MSTQLQHKIQPFDFLWLQMEHVHFPCTLCCDFFFYVPWKWNFLFQLLLSKFSWVTLPVRCQLGKYGSTLQHSPRKFHELKIFKLLDLWVTWCFDMSVFLYVCLVRDLKIYDETTFDLLCWTSEKVYLACGNNFNLGACW